MALVESSLGASAGMTTDSETSSCAIAGRVTGSLATTRQAKQAAIHNELKAYILRVFIYGVNHFQPDDTLRLPDLKHLYE